MHLKFDKIQDTQKPLKIEIAKTLRIKVFVGEQGTRGQETRILPPALCQIHCWTSKAGNSHLGSHFKLT